MATTAAPQPPVGAPRPPQRARRRLGTPALLLTPVMLLIGYAFLAPLLTFLQYSFYRFENGRLIQDFSPATYWLFLTDGYYHLIVLDTLSMAGIVTLCSVAIGYPLAYALWRIRRPALQRWLGLIVFSPILVSVVVRSYGWTVLLADQGPLNYALMGLGLLEEPLELVYNLTGVVISLTHVFLPFVVFPIFSAMLRLDPSLREAAQDLGAGWWTTFRRVTFPLTLPGVVAGAQIAFTLALGAFVTPAILGGGRVLVLPLQVYRATADINWPIAAVGGLALVILAFVAVAAFNRLLKWSEV